MYLSIILITYKCEDNISIWTQYWNRTFWLRTPRQLIDHKLYVNPQVTASTRKLIYQTKQTLVGLSQGLYQLPLRSPALLEHCLSYMETGGYGTLYTFYFSGDYIYMSFSPYWLDHSQLGSQFHGLYSLRCWKSILLAPSPMTSLYTVWHLKGTT